MAIDNVTLPDNWITANNEPWEFNDWHATHTIYYSEMAKAGIPYKEYINWQDNAIINSENTLSDNDKYTYPWIPETMTTASWFDLVAIRLGLNKEEFVNWIWDFLDTTFWERELCTPIVREWLSYMKKHLFRAIHELMQDLLNDFINNKTMIFRLPKIDKSVIQRRDVHSEYPQSQIMGGQDYADNANDQQVEGLETGTGNFQLINLQTEGAAMDKFIAKLEICFSPLFYLDI